MATTSSPKIRLIPCQSHKELAEGISNRLVGLTKTQTVFFANTEMNVKIGDNVRGTHVYIIATGSVIEGRSINDHIMELILTIQACLLSDAKKITVIIPYFPYSRGDKKDESRSPIGSSAISRCLETFQVDRVVSMDLHAGQIQGFFNGPLDNLYAINLFINYFKENMFKGLTQDEINQKFVLISPDAGAVKRTKSYASRLQMSYVILHKDRDYSKANTVHESILVGAEKVVGKTGIIIDDMLDTGGTMVAGINELKKFGVSKVIVVVTHGIFSGSAFDKINSCELIEKVIVTNSLPQEANRAKCPKLVVVDISDLMVEVITRLENGGSVSELFK